MEDRMGGAPSSSDQQMLGTIAEYRLVKARRMLCDLKEGEYPSSECGELLRLTDEYLKENSGKNEGYHNPLRVKPQWLWLSIIYYVTVLMMRKVL